MNSACFSSKKTELTRNLDRIIRVWPVYRQVCDCTVSGIGLDAITFETITTQPSRIGLGRVFEP